jgi:hypothetical protein
MKPSKSILDRSFTYIPSAATSVDATWRRFGWRPLSEDGRTHESEPTAGEHSSGSLSLSAAN